MDSISENRIHLLHPAISNEVLQSVLKIEQMGFDIRITQGLRTDAEQNALYAQGRTAPGKIVTNAKAGQSWHNFGLAFDFILFHKDGSVSYNMAEDANKNGVPDWHEVVQLFINAGYSWGGNWKFTDYPHLEKTFNLTLFTAPLKKRDANGYIIF